MGACILRGRKTKSINVRWKERVVGGNTEGAVMRLVSGRSSPLTDIMHVFGFLRGLAS